MGAFLRLAGILLILGGVIYSVGGYAAVRRAQIVGAGGRPQGSEGLLSLAPWIGIALMALGIIVAIAVLVMFIREWRARKAYGSYTDDGGELMGSPGPGQNDEVAEQSDEDIAMS